jgi:hypothetical protein
VKRIAERYVEHLELLVMLRQDRIARGSDQLAFTREGYPGVRLSETHEHYDRQHQDPRVEGGRAYGDDLAHLDAAYTAKLARGLLAAVATLAAAPAPPRDVVLGGGVSPDTRLRWTLPVMFPSYVDDKNVFVKTATGWHSLAGLDEALLDRLRALDPACEQHVEAISPTGLCIQVAWQVADAGLRGQTDRFKHACQLAATSCPR